MATTESATRPATLEERLRRGAELLLDMEVRGDTGVQYEEWLRGWMELLSRYQAACSLT